MRWLARILLLVVWAGPALADEGRYAVTGTGLDGSAYTGQLELQKRGEVHYAAWTVGPEQYVGVGLLVGEHLSLAIQDRQGLVFIAVYRRTATGWSGIWTILGGSSVGTEVWEKLEPGRGG